MLSFLMLFAKDRFDIKRDKTMDDKAIIELYWERAEAAISETAENMVDIAIQSLTIFFPIRKIPRKV